MNIGDRIAHRLKEERHRRAWSLDELATRSGVSRAMISKIERGVSTPTAVLLARLAEALGQSLNAMMFEPRPPARSLSRCAAQVRWTDPVSGYTRRLVSPAANAGDAEIVAVELPAAARVRFGAAASVGIDGQVLLIEGRLEIALADARLDLAPGDCARFPIHLEHELHNPGNDWARYLVVTRRFDLGPGAA